MATQHLKILSIYLISNIVVLHKYIKYYYQLVDEAYFISLSESLSPWMPTYGHDGIQSGLRPFWIYNSIQQGNKTYAMYFLSVLDSFFFIL